MKTLRLTTSEALVRYLCAQWTEWNGTEVPLFAGVFAIFGHGNVAGLGEVLSRYTQKLPTFRAHNEQGMAHAAVAFAKSTFRRRMMACTTSIGPGATNLVTAAATAHVNRLPLLLLPGDVFASRMPDPVLQQLEVVGQPNLSANDCLRPVSRYFDRIMRPEQLLSALPEALRILTDAAECGPVTLALPQDVQTEAFDFPESFFALKLHTPRRLRADEKELARAAEILKQAKKPLLVVGGGVLYSEACAELEAFSLRHGIPVAETQAGKSALSWEHPLNTGALGVTGTAASNVLAQQADVVLCVGTRLSDFTTASRTLFQNSEVKFVGLNVAPFDAHKHGAIPLVADAREGVRELTTLLSSWKADAAWTSLARTGKKSWNDTIDQVTSASSGGLPTDAQVLGTVNRLAKAEDTVVCAAGGLPGELHKLWKAFRPGGYHLEYGYSCMGYEIAGGMGVKMAVENKGEVFVMVGDGSYLMMNSELATSVMLSQKIIVVLLDNRGFGCINRLQQGLGGEPFNNLLSKTEFMNPPAIDFVKHAESMGALAEKVGSLSDLEAALGRARQAPRSCVLVIETTPHVSTKEGGAFWEVAVAEVSESAKVSQARKNYETQKNKQRLV